MNRGDWVGPMKGWEAVLAPLGVWSVEAMLHPLGVWTVGCRRLDVDGEFGLVEPVSLIAPRQSDRPAYVPALSPVGVVLQVWASDGFLYAAGRWSDHATGADRTLVEDAYRQVQSGEVAPEMDLVHFAVRQEVPDLDEIVAAGPTDPLPPARTTITAGTVGAVHLGKSPCFPECRIWLADS